MLQILELCSQTRIIWWVGNHGLQTLANILSGLLRILQQPLNTSIVHYSHRIHCNIQLFLRSNCSGAQLNNNLTRFSATKRSTFTPAISGSVVGGSDTTQIFLFPGTISTSECDKLLFVNFLYAYRLPPKWFTAPWRNESRNVVKPREDYTYGITAFPFLSISGTWAVAACRPAMLSTSIIPKNVLHQTSDGSLSVSHCYFVTSRHSLSSWSFNVHRWQVSTSVYSAKYCRWNVMQSFIHLIAALKCFLCHCPISSFAWN